MEITDFVAIAIVGAILSTVIQMIKGRWGNDSNNTKLITIALAIGVGGLYVAIRDTAYFQTVVGVLASASTVYSLLLKR